MLSIEEAGALVFCSHCGAPQVRLSEELMQQVGEQANAADAEAEVLAPVEAGAVDWRGAIRATAVISLVASPLLLVFVPMALLVPAVAMVVYHARHKQSQFSAAIGTRFGLLCGLFASAALMVFNTVAMLALRLGGQGGANFDGVIANAMASYKAQMTAQFGAAKAMEVMAMLAVPEFRIGFFLATMAMVMGVLVVLSGAGGAFAGFVRGRTRPASV